MHPDAVGVAAVGAVHHFHCGGQGVEVETVETGAAFGGVDKNHAHALVVVELGGYGIDAPEVADGDVAVGCAALRPAGIARGAQVDVGEEAAHEGVVTVYIGRQNGILVRLRGGLSADDKTVFSPATLGFIPKLNVPDGGLCV